METELLDKLNKLKEPKTDVIQKALELYLQNLTECNTLLDGDVNTECNIGVNSVNQVDPVKSSFQIVDNYEILRHYKEEIDWLRDRVEYFESVCRDFQHDARSDSKTKKGTAISLYRM
jgi:hypothetical protein